MGVAAAVLLVGGVVAGGVGVSMARSFPAAPGGELAAARAADPDRVLVAVAAGSSGTVAADALAPYAVFAASDRFAVRVVAETLAPVTFSGGLHVVPDTTFTGLDRAPDVVVVPAVVDWNGPREAALRTWVAAQAARGAVVLGVCAGAKMLAAAGVLDGRSATTFWSALPDMRSDYPRTSWLAGKRYVEDGPVVTTAGVTSGVVGALRVVERLAGPAEADAVGRRVAYPGWSRTGSLDIEAHSYAPADLPYALNAAFPWGRPTTGVAVPDGVDELALAAVLETHSGSSFAATTVPVAPADRTTTRHGLRLLPSRTTDLTRLIAFDSALDGWAAAHGVPVTRLAVAAGESPFDAALRDLAATGDRATARAAATFTEYPAGHLALSGPAWPWRPTALLVLTLLAATGVAVLLSCLHHLPLVDRGASR
ncbi:DJ-1/PfpI family protein [Saccharothrix mutabilis subsp. mutabilis]|uniref:DJ-1/PfpI family protein n=1 Tax=Saccharothrix mutabilis subsp. mutabilis TaxID=66855 RepID=A0ABN0UFC2_9PSEU